MNVFGFVFLFLQVFMFVICIYWFVLSFFGLGKVMRSPVREPQKKFLLLIPAHNEENVIGNLVKNLINLDYPSALYEICVIADNCTDKTGTIARGLGVTVFEHTSLPDEKRGKPYAIKYALDMFGNQLTEKFDAVAVFDADNLVTLNYLREMNNHLLNGEKLVQCYLDTKNPDDNFITFGYAVSYFYMNRSWQLAKYRLGLGNAVGGTGFCVDSQVLRDVGWVAESLTEDLEFTVRCLLRGVRATWCHGARVFDEKPVKFRGSCVQRLRWARGHWDVCFKYFWRLLLRANRKKDFCALDGAIYLLNPVVFLLGVALWIMWVVGIFVFKQEYFLLFPMWLWVFLLILTCGYMSVVCRLDTDKKFSRVKALLSMVFFNCTYIPLFVWALFTYRDRTWVRTEHVKNISIIEYNAQQVTPSVYVTIGCNRGHNVVERCGV